MLALILVHTLDLTVKNGVRVDDLTGALCQIVGKAGLVRQLDLVQALENGLVVLKLVQLGQIGSIVLVAVADGLVQQLAQTGVRGQQPAAVCNKLQQILNILLYNQMFLL